MKKNPAKKNGSTILLLLFLFIGLSLLLYPKFSNYFNSLRQSKAIAVYSEQVEKLDKETYEKLWAAAQAYNEELAREGSAYILSEEKQAEYNSLLNISGDGIMGSLVIQDIRLDLTVKHGTSDAVLNEGIGHLEWTSLPVGGESTHCVVSGHTGLPTGELIFTELDQLNIGDIFMFRVLNEVLTYEVDQIRIVEPRDTSELQIVPGEDYCTLLTCTPYGINSHRLLVRGHRIPNIEEAKVVRVTANAVQIEPLIIAPLVAVPLLLILLLFVMMPKKQRKK